MKLRRIFCLLFGSLLILTSPATVFSQNGLTASRAQKIMHIDSIPINTSSFFTGTGKLLDKGWRWQQGDDPTWKEPDFNDSSWDSINPLMDVHHSLQIPASKILWLRIRFSIDSSIQQQLALLIQQSGASEVFLNGKLLKRLGIVDTNPAKIRAYDPIFDPILMPPNTNPVQVLAIRYVLEKGVHYSTAFAATTNPLLIAKIQTAQHAIDQYQENAVLMNRYYFFVVGLFFILALIHSGYYFFQKNQKANLYFALYAICYIAYIIWPLVIDVHAVRSKYYALTGSFILVVTVGPLLLAAIYELLNFKKDWVYKLLLLLSIISVFIYFWQYEWGWHIGADVMTLLIQIGIIRIVFKAVYQKRKGSRILATGAVIFLVLFSLFILFTNLQPENRSLISVLFAGGVLSIPLATSLFLGLEFAFLSRSLQQKLFEVNELSQKNIAQEKEKQALLAAQNETLERQVKERTDDLSKSLEDLKATQSQLIQSEKMASLGELTAGIAHEIQNPLNFVNNFSEVNKELADELTAELVVGNLQLATEIANDIKDNSEKINHHGKRADAIVKGMLQHSRISSGQKELTDINALCDEYLRLAYHGLRAKDKSFNVEMITDFDQTIPAVNIIPQDFGRAILNLITNAFYAVNEKKVQVGANYQPTVTVSTKRINDRIKISVKDNGAGIPQKILDKIFQPFFTTKPTGKGTGLGLSLTYDIVTKGHSGELIVESLSSEEAALAGKAEAGAEFVILLPL